MVFKIILAITIFLIYGSQSNNFAQNKFKLKFSASVQAGAFVDVTGEYKNGYNFGGGLGLRTSDLLEIFAEFNVNNARLIAANTVISFNDYSVGTRFYLGKSQSKVRPILETAVGLYPDFKEIAEDNYNRGGFSLGGGASINISKNFEILPKAKLHFAMVSLFDHDPFYVYSGIYIGAKYIF